MSLHVSATTEEEGGLPRQHGSPNRKASGTFSIIMLPSSAISLHVTAITEERSPGHHGSPGWRASVVSAPITLAHTRRPSSLLPLTTNHNNSDASPTRERQPSVSLFVSATTEEGDGGGSPWYQGSPARKASWASPTVSLFVPDDGDAGSPVRKASTFLDPLTPPEIIDDELVGFLRDLTVKNYFEGYARGTLAFSRRHQRAVESYHAFKDAHRNKEKVS